jgi:hypothetical protein
MASQSIDDTFAAIIKDCQTIAVEAVKNAAKKAQKDILDEAKSYLQKYYANYTPTSYPRTYQLKNAIVPVFEDKSSKGGISIEVGVEYDSGNLKGCYRSNSRFHQAGDAWKVVTDHSNVTNDNGIPESGWILDNFIEGIHPRTERVGGSYIYSPQEDGESTRTLMEEFFDMQLPNRINKYVQDELFTAITSRL